MGRVRDGRNTALGVLVASALTAGAFTATPTANASCFSAFGLSNGNGCTSNLTTLAIGIGDGAVANAGNALFGGAIAIGNGANALTNVAAFTFAGAFGNNAASSTLSSLFGLNLQFGAGTASTLNGILNLVLSVNPADVGASVAGAVGLGNVAIQLGPGSSQTIGGFNLSLGLPGGGSGTQQTGASGLGNIAAQIGAGIAQTVGFVNVALSIVANGTGTQTTTAGLLGSFALNLFGDAGSVTTQSYFSSAINILGTNNVLVQGLLSAGASLFGTGNTISMAGNPLAPLSLALNAFGNGNTVKALYGPLSFVTSILQEAQTLIQRGPGININHFPGSLLPSAAAASGRRVLPAGANESKTSTGAESATSAVADSTTSTTDDTRAKTPQRAFGSHGESDRINTGARSGRHSTATITGGDSSSTTGTVSGRHRKTEASSDTGDDSTKPSSTHSVGGGKHRKR
ncbi:hypothetical protein CRM90_24665 [Mycobacterium sp. ENV421]|uniref:hypothetical protein n=1 Tax=Mycobacterium sp. ENV421 TaxID=1213407 RepID=UPI000C9AB968|nr:hypothetical protein [Mycobacterium sp. ENV421]PND55041.1 hypothetical protein CRM90_24665 [Mycobacterium sp. ENV421]